MKTKLALLRSIGALLALLVFTALPCSTALAKGPCALVQIYYDYDPSGDLLVSMYSYPPYGPTIFYTVDGTNPTHDHTNGTPTGSTMVFNPLIPPRVSGRGRVHHFQGDST